ncbi:MAG: hypothetical protein QOF76_2397 [Solirubrobacteraceae bacterium]|jgi:putative nucleotidyltransferase with HDIG domain|nr:hypothetical protein [Solirubrobacteraceae bacterium]
MPRRGILLIVGQLAFTIAIACLTLSGSTDPGDWDPIGLFWLIGGAAVVSAMYPLKIREGMVVNGTAVVFVLGAITLNAFATVLLVAFAVTVMALRRNQWGYLPCNLAGQVPYALAGVMASEAQNLGWFDSGLAIVACTTAIFLLVNALNFLMVAIDDLVLTGDSIVEQARISYLPVLSVQVVSALLTGMLVFGYIEWGVTAITLLTVVGLIFQYVLHVAIESTQRGDELKERTEQLAALQFGLITMTLKTLALRDNSTARHSTAVARYSRAVAQEMGLSERDQEVIHIAALFHDIGKFVFPDSILKADRRLTLEEREIVNSHSAVGADLIAGIEGYGRVAELVRSHHERIDGFGYPDRLAGDEIPLGSRIISVADIYDVITARDTYRTPVTVSEAIAELRRSAGTQLDAEVVEVFIRLVLNKGLAFRHATEDDFEAELALEHRIRDYAEPRVAV